jgi:hypothetical protein
VTSVPQWLGPERPDGHHRETGDRTGEPQDAQANWMLQKSNTQRLGEKGGALERRSIRILRRWKRWQDRGRSRASRKEGVGQGGQPAGLRTLKNGDGYLVAGNSITRSTRTRCWGRGTVCGSGLLQKMPLVVEDGILPRRQERGRALVEGKGGGAGGGGGADNGDVEWVPRNVDMADGPGIWHHARGYSITCAFHICRCTQRCLCTCQSGWASPEDMISQRRG